LTDSDALLALPKSIIFRTI